MKEHYRNVHIKEHVVKSGVERTILRNKRCQLAGDRIVINSRGLDRVGSCEITFWGEVVHDRQGILVISSQIMIDTQIRTYS